MTKSWSKSREGDLYAGHKEKKFLQLVEPVSLKHVRTLTRLESSIKPEVELSGPFSQRPPPGPWLDAGTLLHLEVYSGQLTKLMKL